MPEECSRCEEYRLELGRMRAQVVDSVGEASHRVREAKTECDGLRKQIERLEESLRIAMDHDLLREIRDGLEDVKASRVVPHDELTQEFDPDA